MNQRDSEKPFWQQYSRAILWGIAAAGIVVSILTRFRFVFVFLPLVFAPAVFGRGRGPEDE